MVGCWRSRSLHWDCWWFPLCLFKVSCNNNFLLMLLWKYPLFVGMKIASCPTVLQPPEHFIPGHGATCKQKWTFKGQLINQTANARCPKLYLSGNLKHEELESQRPHSERYLNKEGMQENINQGKTGWRRNVTYECQQAVRWVCSTTKSVPFP